MGLKGYRLWVMGQLDSTCRAPPRRRRPASQPPPAAAAARKSPPYCSGTSWNLKKQILKMKTRFSLHSFQGLGHQALPSLWVNWIRLVQPRAMVSVRTGCVGGDAATKRRDRSRSGSGAGAHHVAVQVAFERQTLKPVFSLDML
jgi:hypothetical protein